MRLLLSSSSWCTTFRRYRIRPTTTGTATAITVKKVVVISSSHLLATTTTRTTNDVAFVAGPTTSTLTSDSATTTTTLTTLGCCGCCLSSSSSSLSVLRNNNNKSIRQRYKHSQHSHAATASSGRRRQQSQSSLLSQQRQSQRRYVSTSSATTTSASATASSTTSTTKTTTDIDDTDTDNHDRNDHRRLIVVGSGVAGCATALVAAELYSLNVTLLYAGTSCTTDTNSYWAQGGIIYRGRQHSHEHSSSDHDNNVPKKKNVMAEDSWQLLAHDIMRAGAGLSLPQTVRKVAMEGPNIVQQLLLDSTGKFANVPFDRCQHTGHLSLCLEASHSAPRILHYKDATGRVISEEITKACIQHPLIDMRGNTIVTDLIVREGMCIGVKTLLEEQQEQQVDDDDDSTSTSTSTSSKVEWASHGTVLCAGGLAGIYQHSTNPRGFNALGSSIALAERVNQNHNGSANNNASSNSNSNSNNVKNKKKDRTAFVETKELEFVQFHPTSLHVPTNNNNNNRNTTMTTNNNSDSNDSGATNTTNDTTTTTTTSCFLLTEALRGEGAVLRNARGERFMDKLHSDAELAPRDVVARGVYEESKKQQQRQDNDERRNENNDGDNNDNKKSHVYLDITHRETEWLHRRFPTIQAHVSRTAGLDIGEDWLPIVPAAHYTCGGIVTDLHGRTTLSNLYAAGEAARTGLHGGNRLASTSLLEGLVFGSAVAHAVGRNTNKADTVRGLIEKSRAGSQSETSSSSLTPTERQSIQKDAHALLQCVRKCMWDHVGVIRTTSGLKTALDELQTYREEATHLFEQYPTRETAGVRDAAVAGHAVCRAALENRTSIGSHCIVIDDDDDDDDRNDDNVKKEEEAQVDDSEEEEEEGEIEVDNVADAS